MIKFFILPFPLYLLYMLLTHITGWVSRNGWDFHGYVGWGFAFLWGLEVLVVQVAASIIVLAILKLRKSPLFLPAKKLTVYALLSSLLILILEGAL